MDSKSLAHDLNANVWRSEDVDVSTYLKHGDQMEIKTPFHQTSDSNDFFLKNATENTSFCSLLLNEQIVEDLKRCGFVRPSPIQTTCIPLGRLGVDLIAQSKSGTGKTMVFVLCALELIINDLNDPPFTKVLIVAPTREIAVQIADIIESLTINWKNFSCYKAIGGTKVSENISKLYVSQIVVGTPGRICCLLELDFLKPHLIRLFVLDECDKLMEENFRKQIDKIYNRLPVNKQMIVTSATMSTEMTTYLSKYMNQPVLIKLNANQPSLIGVMQYILRIKGHHLDYMNFESKIDPLIHLLKNIQFNQCFVFLNYQTRVNYLHEKLNTEGLSVTYITGDMSQKDRLQKIDLFRKQKFKIFISTDLTSRGIDIESVNLVINVDIPFDCETYLHRVGRSGRFGSPGIAITIVGSDNEYEKFYSTISQYNLKIKELNLSSVNNLWELFYQERLDTISSENDQCSIKINPRFEKMESIYSQLLIESGESTKFNNVQKKSSQDNEIFNNMNDDDLATSNIFVNKHSKSLQFILQKLISSTATTITKNDSPTTTNTEITMINENKVVLCPIENFCEEKISDNFDNVDDYDCDSGDNKDENDVISLQHEIFESFNGSLENPSRYLSLSSSSSSIVMKSDSIVPKKSMVTNNIERTASPPKAAVAYQSRPTFSIDPANLFRQTFLNTANIMANKSFLFKAANNHNNNNNNLNICKYLLKGGKL